MRTGRIIFVCLVTISQSVLTASEPLVGFQTQIAPLIQQHCIRCHSPGNREGDLSLATFEDLKRHDWVIAGAPARSYLIEQVTHADGQAPAMPQEAAPLSVDEVALLSRWIAQGAQWPEEVVITEKPKADASWWAYQPLRASGKSDPMSRPTEPTQRSGFSIDALISARLAEQGLGLSPPADRRTLIRRLSFDLHGLPPTPEQVVAFVNDSDPDAYGNLVDRMLASPRYGERFAQHWLDISHYADTHGFERDKRRDHAWRYRDYVIQALNADKPYDRFLQEQIAGDVLWPEYEQAVIATGFLAAGPWDFVGQVETKSPLLRRTARSLDLDDMVTQVMTATMAMTVNCARCHDHKLDPISQREYYQLQAVFAGVRRANRVVSKSRERQGQARRAELVTQRDKINEKIARLEGSGWDLADIVGGGNGMGTGADHNGIDTRNGKSQTGQLGRLSDVVLNRFNNASSAFVDGVFIPDGEAAQAHIPVSSTGITITNLPKTSGEAWDMIRNGPVKSQHSPELEGIDFTKPGHHLLGLHANAGITFDLAAIKKAHLPEPTEQGLQFTTKVGYFGARGNSHADAWVFLDGQQRFHFPALRRADGLQSLDILLPPTARFLTLVATDGGDGISMDQIGFGDPQLRPAAAETLAPTQHNELAQLRQQRNHIVNRLAAWEPAEQFYGVVSQAPVPPVRLLVRGDAESPTGDALPPTALSALAMLDPKLGTTQSSDGERRAALARWITHPDNPLAPRVMVNRIWQWHFGTGIVDTPSDFGFGGGRPSHPELLDGLANALVEHHGSLKMLHRMIVTSQTYRQASRYARPNGHGSDATRAVQIDADNRLLWRQNPRRIEAEAIRDAVLSVSGKLNGELGGPGFEDFRYTEAYAPIYTYFAADSPELWRRSIYRYIVRTTPDQFLTTLDCPDPANLTARRLTTTTPLQSLALYNNEFMLRQARYFAERLEQEAGSDRALQVDRAFRLAFGRPPTNAELALAVEFIQQQGLFGLCRSLFNANEFVYVD